MKNSASKEVVTVMDGWNSIWGALMMILFWGGLAAVVIFAVRTVSASREGTPRSADAKAVLETRFAKGEISQEEFEERRQVLDSSVR